MAQAQELTEIVSKDAPEAPAKPKVTRLTVDESLYDADTRKRLNWKLAKTRVVDGVPQVTDRAKHYLDQGFMLLERTSVHENDFQRIIPALDYAYGALAGSQGGCVYEPSDMQRRAAANYRISSSFLCRSSPMMELDIYVRFALPDQAAMNKRSQFDADKSGR